MNTNKAKNVILFVGDGMGVQTHTASRIYKGQKKDRVGEDEILVWERFPYSGQSKVYNTDFQVPDSAGTATALFTGVKTRMAVLGIDSAPPYNSCDPDLLEKSRLKTLLHKAVEDGKATGIITTTRVTHATPAGLYAAVQNRDWEADSNIPAEYNGKCSDIAKQLVYSDLGQKINLVFGGGRRNFITQSEGGKRLDENLIDIWKRQKEQAGHEYDVLFDKNDLDSWRHTDFTLGLFSHSEMQYALERDPEKQPSLDMMTKEAIHRLKRNPNGFFLMVEGALIDYAHHRNWPKKAFEETLELEKAVQVALELTDEQETLIVVTADHSHSMTINGYPNRGNSIFGYTYNEQRNLLNLQPDGSRAAWSTISYANGLGFWEHYTNDSSRPWKDIRDLDYEDNNYRAPAMLPAADEYETHGGEDVPILANGPWSHLFTGVHEQSYIAHAIEYAAGWSNLPMTSTGTWAHSLSNFQVVFLSLILLVLS